MTKMKKILYIGGFELPDKNAAAQRVLANAKLLREMNFKVKFVGISKDIANAPQEIDGFQSNPIPYPKSTKDWFHQILTFIDAERVISENPDYVVLYNFPSVASLKILKACHKHGIKVIHDLTEWESAPHWDARSIMRKIDINLRMRYCMKRMDGVICISRYLFDFYRKYTRVILVPPTVNLDDPKWDRNRLISTNEQVKLIYAGNAEFGTKDRLDIIVQEVGKNPMLWLDIIGMTKDQYENGYKTKINYPNIVFHGRIPHKQAVKAVQDADFQMLIRESTLKNNAGFPTKFVESISSGTPLIATLTSNIGDYIVDGKNSIIVNDMASISEILSRVGRLTKDERKQMKCYCLGMTCFDYRMYKDELSKMFY